MSDYPMRKWFMPKSGIAREVITADIQRYLGPDATVKPGIGDGEYAGQDGYIITAYRTLTSAMIRDLQSDSLRWHQEVVSRDPVGRESRKGKYESPISYQDSGTHKSRQHYGPSQPSYQQQSQQLESSYGQPTATPQYGVSTQRTHAEYTYNPSAYTQTSSQYMTTPDYGQAQVRTTPTYSYTQPAGSAHSQYYASAPQDAPRYSYTTTTDPSRDQASQQYYASAQQPSSSAQYYQQGGGAYPQSSQQQDQRRRR